ncbi:MAG: SLBB domain-containing protein [Fimbriimonadaceae bacterium]|nr:SLBB domain-containing protein [Fimbriimonadaceae bacterium]
MLLLAPLAHAQATGNGAGQGTGGQTGGQTGGEPGGGEPAAPPAPATPPPAAPAGGDAGAPTTNTEKRLARYGDEFFETSRAAIQTLRQRAQAGAGDANAFSGATGPISLGNVTATAPETYQLGPGDRLTLRVGSPFTETTETKLTIDSLGAVVVPQSSNRIILRGQTLRQAESLLRQEIARYINRPTVLLLLDELRTFQVTVLGESFAPGAYTVPATFSLFNLILATGGPNPRGTLRSIQLRRNNTAMRTFDLYRFLISGDARQDLPLQPGDVIFFPVAKGEISVEGEVNRPGVFEITGSESLQSILVYAGGIRPSGVAQNVAIDSVVPGSERRLLNVDVRDRSLQADPPIRDGDKIRVFSIRPLIRNQVEIQGPVEQPRSYAIRPGMRVRDLVQLAFGLRPEADLSVAEVRRANPDGSQTLIRINLGEAMKGAAESNIELRPDDTLRVFDVNDTAWRGDRKVALQGAVRNPGEFIRADGMRIGDLLRQGRGLEPNAFSEEADLQRFNADGTPGPLIKISLIKAALGDPAHDLVLQDRDQLRVYSVAERQAVPELSVAVAGAVQRPGNYPLAEEMRIADLLRRAGGPALNAFRTRAFLQRTNLDGTLGPLVIVDLDKALSGDPTANQALLPRDVLTVYTIQQAEFLSERTVTILGGVQRPGEYPRGENMTLAQLISLAGGTIPTSDSFALIASANVPEGTDAARVSLADASTVILKDLDRVTVPLDSSILEQPIQVVIRGAVANPGTYFFSRRDARFVDLLNMAGGLRAEAWLKGGQVARRPDLLRTETQTSQQPRIQEVLKLVQEDEYRRAVAKSEVDRLIVINSTKGGASPFMIPGLTPVAPSAPQEGQTEKVEIKSTDLVTPARLRNAVDQLAGGNLAVRLEDAVRNPGSHQNFTLLPGDVITIPETPSTVLVEGPGVTLPQAFIYEPGKSLRDYIERSGGFTIDADRDNILIIRPGGSLFRPRPSTRIELGDVIYVPTRVMITRLGSNRDDFDRAVRSVTNGALLYGIFRELLK